MAFSPALFLRVRSFIIVALVDCSVSANAITVILEFGSTLDQAIYGNSVEKTGEILAILVLRPRSSDSISGNPDFVNIALLSNLFSVADKRNNN